jgi:hypothetical protein
LACAASIAACAEVLHGRAFALSRLRRPDFFHKHPSCSFITCAVRNKGLEACSQCADFPCAKFKSEKEYEHVKESSSYPPYRKVMANLKAIKEHGIEAFAKQQAKRIKLLERMLANFDDGRSKSCYCRSAALLDLAALESALDAATRQIRADRSRPTTQTKAKILRALLDVAP